MNRFMKRFLAVCVCLALFASYGFSLAEDAPDSRIARKENVYETAKQIFAISWMPKDTEISVLDEGYGLWNIQAKDGTNSILAYMQIDGDNEDIVVYYRKATYELPALNCIGEQIIPKDGLTGTGIKWAEEVFCTFRGSLDSDYPVNCIAQVADNCILISFGEVSEAIAILIAKTSENPNETPELMAYVDMDFNWDVRYDGYISLGDIVMGESWFILFDTFGYYDEDEGDIPEGFIEPLWVIEIQDQRADPTLECYDPSLSFFTYPVLIDPSNGDVVEIREPERYGHG